MKASMGVLVLLLAVAPSATATANPLSKVFELMDALTAKIQAEGEVEAKAYHEFVEWCDDTASTAQNEIKSATQKKEKLAATIDKSADDAESATAKIADLAGSIKEDEAELKKATEVREKEAADFGASEKEMVESVDVLGRAIGVLSKNAASLAQVDVNSFDSLMKGMSAVIDAASFASDDKQKLTALLQAQDSDSSDDEDMGAPAAAAHKSKSGGIVEILEDMKEKAEDQLATLRKAETEAKQNYGMLAGSLNGQLGADNKEMSEQKAVKADSEEAKATAEGELSATTKGLAESKTALETCSSDCMQTAADHEATMKAREEELKVIAEAKQIVKEATSLAQESAVSMLQLRTEKKNNDVATMVKKLAKVHHSAALAQLASRITAVVQYQSGGDVFSKIKGLISDMVGKLEREAEEDASEKAYCDEQMGKTEEKQSDLEDDVKKLTVKNDESASKSTQLKEEVKEIQAELAALSKEQSELDRIRKETHSAYADEKAELEKGLTGVRKALGVLREYYGGAASAAMVQEDDEQPKVPVHQKSDGAGGSIISLLEVCEGDLAKGLTALETEEADAQSEYDTITQENKVAKTTKEQDVKYKTQEAKGLDKSIAEISADIATQGQELSAVNEYYSKIKERCVAKPESFEERAKRRQAEIDGLKEALTILENEASFVQRHSRRLRAHQ